jgi:hypothetical protein
MVLLASLAIGVIIVDITTAPRVLGINSTGIIVRIDAGLYSDINCTVPLESLEWGTLYAGGSKNQTVYLRNQGDTSFQLVLNMTNFDPTRISDYIRLTTDYKGQDIVPEEVLRLEIMLEAGQSSNSTSFSFDILITCLP